MGVTQYGRLYSDCLCCYTVADRLCHIGTPTYTPTLPTGSSEFK